MRIRQLIKGLGGALVAAVLVFSSPASADTQLIHFDDATQGWKWYSDVDRNFLFDPTNLQSSSACADPTPQPGGSANGICVAEGTGQNGLLPTMTHRENGPTLQGSSNADPDASGDQLAFTLDAFYFFFNGLGGKDKDTGLKVNAITVAGSNGASFTFQLGAPLPAGPEVSHYETTSAGIEGALVTTTPWLVKDTGYVATFGNLFADVSWIQFSGPPTAQLRLDCIVATFSGSTTEPLSGFTGGCGIGEPPTNGVPAPGTLALLGLGLVGVGLTRRRRRV